MLGFVCKMSGSEQRLSPVDGPYTDAFREAPMSQQSTPAPADRPDLKRCTHCKQHKPRGDFHNCRSRGDGLNNKCKTCTAKLIKLDRLRHGEKRAAAFKRWREANGDHVRAKEAQRRLERRALCLIATSRTRARKRGLEFDLEKHADEIQARIDRGFCELTGEPFDLSPGRKFNSPSLDRIDPCRGYTYDNVRVVLNLMNVAMNTWGEDTLRMVMTKWLK